MEQKRNEEEDRILELVNKLNHHEEFTTWRDIVAKPYIEKMENTINMEADKLDEVVLRANLKALQAIKYLFYGVLDQAAFQSQMLREEIEEKEEKK